MYTQVYTCRVRWGGGDVCRRVDGRHNTGRNSTPSEPRSGGRTCACRSDNYKSDNYKCIHALPPYNLYHIYIYMYIHVYIHAHCIYTCIYMYISRLVSTLLPPSLPIICIIYIYMYIHVYTCIYLQGSVGWRQCISMSRRPTRY